jgi:hypothetical protein
MTDVGKKSFGMRGEQTMTEEYERESDDYDSPWKGLIEGYFTDFLAWFFPKVHAGIDWARGYEFLDQELAQVTRDAGVGRRRLDKLARRTGSGCILRCRALGNGSLWSECLSITIGCSTGTASRW